MFIMYSLESALSIEYFVENVTESQVHVPQFISTISVVAILNSNS